MSHLQLVHSVPRNIDGLAPPRALESECAVIASCILDPTLVRGAAALLQPDHFFSEAHRRTWEAILARSEAKEPIDVVTIGEWLRAHGRLDQVGGMAYLVGMLDSVPAISNIDQYVRQIFDTWRLRSCAVVVQEFLARAYSNYEDVQELLEKQEQEVARIMRLGRRHRVLDNLEALKSEVKRLASMEPNRRVTGIATGLSWYDELTAGLHGTELTIVAARPGLGKSSMLGQWAAHIAASGIGVSFISLEMTHADILRRVVCGEANVNTDTVRRNGMSQTEWSRFAAASNTVAKWPLWIDETPGQSASRIRECIYSHMEHGRLQDPKVPLGVVFVDFLQFIARGHGQEKMPTHEYLAQASRALVETAKELKIPIVAAAALNRDIDKSSKVRRPKMSDLRDCGNLESDAHNIVFLHRGATVNKDGREEYDDDRVEIILEKQRNGPRNQSAMLQFNGATSRFRYDGDTR